MWGSFMEIMMSNLYPSQLAELQRLSSTILRKSTNTEVTSGVAQTIDVHTHTHKPQDTIKVKVGSRET